MIRGYHAVVSQYSYLADSDGNVRRERPYLDWLLENYDSEIKVCYDIDSFVACLLRLIQITPEEAKTLTEKERLNFDGYDLTYFPGRYFSIGKGKAYNRPYVSFSDMSRFIEPLTHSSDKIIEKAKLARDTAINIQSVLKEIGGGIDSNAVGSISRSLKPVMAKLTRPPTHLDVPQEVIELAIGNVKGNWVEAFKMGFIKECYDLDMSSAYASFLADLPDIRRGKWVVSEKIPDGAILGFAKGRITRRSGFSPFLYRTKNSLHGVVGSWDDVLNLDEIRFIERWGADDFRINRGWWWIPEGEFKYPYRGLVNWLWTKRQTSKGMAREWIKLALANLWGQTLADYGDDFGEYYNPVYGAYVESRCRLKVAEFVLSRGLEKNLCHVAVDGAMFDCPVKLDEKPGMGNWRVSFKAPAIIVNSGYVFVEGKAGQQEFSHSYEWLKREIDSNPGQESYSRKRNVVVSLGESVAHDKMDKLGMIQEVSEDVIIGSERKRFYLEMPKTGEDLMSHSYESKPLNLDMILAMEGVDA